MRYWLMKSEPTAYGIHHLVAEPAQTIPWFGIRNYQARNFMRDQMRIGDLAFFYHSNCKVPGIVGMMRVSKLAYPDATQFDPHNPYFDPTSSPDAPRWLNVDMTLVQETPLVSLDTLRAHPELAGMRVLARGNRLSITPVDPAEWNFITKRLLSL
jgi:predicted RNA-binding protein with PUA-like domain